jgi:hypothetical protein
MKIIKGDYSNYRRSDLNIKSDDYHIDLTIEQIKFDLNYILKYLNYDTATEDVINYLLRDDIINRLKFVNYAIMPTDTESDYDIMLNGLFMFQYLDRYNDKFINTPAFEISVLFDRKSFAEVHEELTLLKIYMENHDYLYCNFYFPQFMQFNKDKTPKKQFDYFLIRENKDDNSGSAVIFGAFSPNFINPMLYSSEEEYPDGASFRPFHPYINEKELEYDLYLKKYDKKDLLRDSESDDEEHEDSWLSVDDEIVDENPGWEWLLSEYECKQQSSNY